MNEKAGEICRGEKTQCLNRSEGWPDRQHPLLVTSKNCRLQRRVRTDRSLDISIVVLKIRIYQINIFVSFVRW